MQNECLRCGHEWRSIIDSPRECPSCKSYSWNKSRPRKFSHICLRCNLTWKSLKRKPSLCPSCHSYNWTTKAYWVIEKERREEQERQEEIQSKEKERLLSLPSL